MARGDAELSSKVGLAVKFPECAGKRFVIIWRDEASVLAVLDELGRAPDSGGDTG